MDLMASSVERQASRLHASKRQSYQGWQYTTFRSPANWTNYWCCGTLNMHARWAAVEPETPAW